ncbi:TIGR01777 family oxidoreductase [Hymenobacter sediminicola]|uniref:TIGR01777 family protein n=1 Tax=Hymenobacter sediminicola TaxID=2761579 RepID=A0A7G7W9R6_9BACT|nr:TIGR01777 family oxidoreductase [Hymenobacter sediminicola]QNH63109.1 TIGR01777 family protein [Hymenobacter sediminicola]
MERLKLILAGGNGFLGQHLARHFTHLGYEVVTLGRSAKPGTVHWNGRTLGPWAAELEGAAVLINLAGRTVDCRYNATNKYAIIRSRTESTRVLAEAVAACRNPPAVWLNSSTATIYQHTEDEQPANTEATGQLGRTFSEMVAQQWEAEFNLAYVPHTRRVALRTAIVLGADGGALPVMARLARLGLSTQQGNGCQWVSWLHIQDFCRAVEFLVARPQLKGVFNLCAPTPLPNAALMQLLDAHYRPRWHLPQPRWLLEIGAFLLRTETELILKSRKVVPQRLLEAGFRFQFPSCEAALTDLLPRLS